MRKQLDPRIPTLIRNNVALNHRSFFVIVGDKGKDQVVNLHFLLSQSRVQSRPNVLWCYKKDLGFTTHRKKREQKIKNEIKRGIREKGEGDPFELFVSLTDIRYCYYKDTPKILGQTYGMLILQDFEAVTPNMLARTIETVEGGGVVILLLKTMSSLRQLYSLGMDVHRSYRSNASDDDPVARFNERFLLSLGANQDTLLLDDELNVLPLSKGKDIKPLPETSTGAGTGVGSTVRKGKERVEAEEELSELKDQVRETKVVGEVVRHAKTLDQAKAVLTILDILASSSLSTTVALTAARGRGKSAALGLCIAAAVAHGYSNIFVTSPSPENLKTLFEFVFKGLDALGYEEVADWDLQRGTGEWKDVVVRVNIFRGHRQTIQYIQPQDHQVLGQAELVVIDEAAAIPLPLVRNLMGPYLVFLSSTINGYEGTGRSLSLKLIQQLRDNARGVVSASGADDSAASSSKSSRKEGKSGLNTGRAAGAALAARSLKEVELKEPIRYSRGDKIESWLHQLLCLDASLTRLSSAALKAKGCPHPSSCDLYMVNRDALFSYHPASEVFLQRMMALYVASHYKNSPNDLQLMSDAPGHRLFVLLAPLKGNEGGLPEPLCVIQVALEGNISRGAVLNSLSRGTREAGDLIPWLVAQQFQDADFASLSGARVVRIAVHPDYARMGYGARALEALEAFYSGQLLDVDNVRDDLDDGETFTAVRDKKISKDANLLQGDEIRVRDAARMPALLQRLSERRPEQLDWLGVSYGLTPQLFKFWKKAGYTPLWVRQIANDLTGEYTTVQLKALDTSTSTTGSAWLGSLAADFRKRFISLLSYRFREFSTITALTVLEAATQGARLADADEEVLSTSAPLSAAELRTLLTPFDMKRLDSYSNNMVEMSVVLDLLPTLAALYFNNRLRAVREDEATASAIDAPEEEEELRLSGLQSSLLLAIGLQRKTPDDISAELRLPLQQAMALFVKTVRLLVKSLRKVEKKAIAQSMPELGSGLDARAPLRKKANGAGADEGDDWTALKGDLQSELRDAGKEFLANNKQGEAHGQLDNDEDEDDEDEDDEEHEDEEDEDEEDDEELRAAKQKLIDSMDLAKYAIKDDDDNANWSQAEAEVASMLRKNGGKDLKGFNTTISVKGTKRAAEEAEKAEASPKKGSDKKGSKGAKSKKQKRR